MSCDVGAHSPDFPLLHLRHRSFSNPSVVLPTSQLILQPFRCFTYVTAHSPTLPLLHLHHSSFSNPSLALPTSQLILQPFLHFTYVTAHSPTLPLLHLRHSSFSNPFFRFSYVTGFSLTSPGEPPVLWCEWSVGRVRERSSGQSPTLPTLLNLRHLTNRTFF